MKRIEIPKKNLPDYIEEFNGLIQAFRDINTLDPKTKQLVFVGIKSLMGDVLSTQYHVQLAKKHGATSEEIMQIILISSMNTDLIEKKTGSKIEINAKILSKIENGDTVRFNVKRLGRITENKLSRAGINSLESLRMIGSEQAFLQVIKIDPHSNLRMLFTLECVINNIKRDEISNKRQKELLIFFKKTKRRLSVIENVNR